MLKKNTLASLFLTIFLSMLFSVSGWAGSPPAISITGAVQQPLNLTMEDLRALQSITVRLNEVTMDEEYNGVFYFRGIPLRTLLELAAIRKEKTSFPKPVDLAILVRNKQGKQVVLSWGEIFYGNHSEVVLAFSATPIIPHHDCNKCHEPEEYQERLEVLSRPVGYPKLVVANDFYSDRCLEHVTSIEVFDLRLKMKRKKMERLYSSGFTVTGDVKKNMSISRLNSYQHVEIIAKMVGDGAGYHGMRSYGGVLLSELLQKAGVQPDVTQGFIFAAPDGYRALLSSGEVFLSSRGKHIIIADQIGNETIEEGGRFKLLLAGDLAADRWVKAINNIVIVTFKQKPGF